LGIQVLVGRDISDADTPASPRIAVVNESFAKRFLQNGALSHRLGDLPGAEIVGVVQDSKYAQVREDELPAVYYPLKQTGMLGQITVEARAAGDPMALLPAMRRVVREIDPDLPLQKPMTQAAQFAETYITPRLFARLAMGFGILAIVLVATGIYGTLAYRVQRRTNEIGVRMALGAHRSNVLRMVARESLLIVGIGIAFGLPVSLFVSQFLRSQLYELSYLDSVSFTIAIVLTFSIASAAALIPARRAAKVDPVVALRYE